jgi:tRNA(adenine34) deaminase
MNYRLLNTTLYVTVEPCVMCMGAILHARVKRLVFGAKDVKWGACGSLYHLADDRRFNHHPEIIGGVCEEACRVLIQNFFRGKRKRPGIGYDQLYTNG